MASVSPRFSVKLTPSTARATFAFGAEPGLQVPHFQQRRLGHVSRRSRGSSASRSPSPTICSDSTVNTMQMPGARISQAPLHVLLRRGDHVAQVGSGGGTPAPRDHSAASVRMEKANTKVPWTSSGDIRLGSR